MDDLTKETGGWSPYALEGIRMAHLRRKRIRGILLLLALLGFWAWMFEETTTREQSIFVNGREAQSGIQIETPDETERQDHVTVSLSPGRVTRAEAGSDGAPESTIQRSDQPAASRAPPVPWFYYLYKMGPWLLVGLGAYLLTRRRGKLDEVNYGVYKGSMPYEMITAAGQRAVFTRRAAHESVFGKRRGDHIPSDGRAELAVLEEQA